MNPHARNWIGVSLAATAAAIGLMWESTRVDELRVERERLRHERRTWRQLEAEHRALRDRQPSSDEVARLRADRAALHALRAEVAELCRRTNLPPRKSAADLEPRQHPRSVPVAEWKNVGRSTASAALETMLWAAAGGEVEALADTLLLDAASREAADRWLHRLPVDARSRYATPERLVATMTARDVPLGAMQIIATTQSGAGEELYRVRLQAPDGSAKTATLALRSVDGGWRLVVPAHAVEKYLAQLGP